MPITRVAFYEVRAFLKPHGFLLKWLKLLELKMSYAASQFETPQAGMY
jgi:hypothetical protein